MNLLSYSKALAALVGSVATALLGIYADTATGHVLTVIAAVATAVATFGVPNLDPNAQHQDESVQPPRHRERGAVDAGLVLGLAVFVLIVVVILRVLHLV